MGHSVCCASFFVVNRKEVVLTEVLTCILIWMLGHVIIYAIYNLLCDLQRQEKGVKK